MTLLSRLTHIMAAVDRRGYFDHVTEKHNEGERQEVGS